MTDYRFRDPVDRRRKPDLWTRIPGALGLIGWLLLLTALGFIGAAKPDFDKVFGWEFEGPIRQYWHYDMIRNALYCTITACGMGITGLLINSRRRRRKKDFFRDSLVLLTIVSLIGTIIHLYRF